LATSANEEAYRRHSQALAIAREIGAHNEEAWALEGMGNSLLSSNPGEAAGYLRQARLIYQRLGSPDAQRTQGRLTAQGP
jgi:hypothetical protein